jgi:hypothetical protein
MSWWRLCGTSGVLAWCVSLHEWGEGGLGGYVDSSAVKFEFVRDDFALERCTNDSAMSLLL